MSKSLTKRDSKSKKNKQESLTGWDKVIADAKYGILRLQRAIEVYKENKAAGMPWPGSQKNAETAVDSVSA